MKLYQHHDEVQDQGKATPKPKRPTRHTYHGRAFGAEVSIERQTFISARDESRSIAKREGKKNPTHPAVIAAMLSL